MALATHGEFRTMVSALRFRGDGGRGNGTGVGEAGFCVGGEGQGGEYGIKDTSEGMDVASLGDE